MRLKIEYLPSYVGEPIKQARSGDAGFDLRATTDGYILPGGFVKIPLGIRTSFEEGYEADILVLSDSHIPYPRALSPLERLERFAYLHGDINGLEAKWVRGRRLF